MVALKDLNFNDIVKYQIINCLNASREESFKLINSVSMLEQLLLIEIPKTDYYEMIEKHIAEIQKNFPRWKVEEQEKFLLEISKIKFGLLVSIVKQLVPQVLISSEIEDVEEIKKDGEEVVDEITQNTKPDNETNNEPDKI